MLKLYSYQLPWAAQRKHKSVVFTLTSAQSNHTNFTSRLLLLTKALNDEEYLTPQLQLCENREQIGVRRTQRLKELTANSGRSLYSLYSMNLYYSRAIKNKVSESTHCKLTNKELIVVVLVCFVLDRNKWDMVLGVGLRGHLSKSNESVFLFEKKNIYIYMRVFFIYFFWLSLVHHLSPLAAFVRCMSLVSH